MNNYDIFLKITQETRKQIIELYSIPDGACIESSEIIEKKLKELGFNPKFIEGWVQYDYYDGCTNRSYDEHSWIECEGYIIDATGDQFNTLMEYKMPDIYISKKYPTGWYKEEPENLL